METEFSEGTRGQLMERISQRLEALDHETLLRLDQLTEQVEADMGMPNGEGMTQRRFLQGALAGGAAGLTVAAGGSLVAWKTGTAAGRTAAELEAVARALKLKELLGLYEKLENIQLDAIVRTGMAAVGIHCSGEWRPEAWLSGLAWIPLKSFSWTSKEPSQPFGTASSGRKE